jgi:hypothetical protein
MYLLLYADLNKEQCRWLTKYALAVAPLCWIHNSHVEGTYPVKIDKKNLQDLQSQVKLASLSSLKEIENKIKDQSMRGKSKDLFKNKLQIIVGASQNLEIIGWAQDLLILLGDPKEQSSTKPPTIYRKNQLGIDEKAVESYLLELAKKPTIH